MLDCQKLKKKREVLKWSIDRFRECTALNHQITLNVFVLIFVFVFVFVLEIDKKLLNDQIEQT